MKTYKYAKDDHGQPIKIEVKKPKTKEKSEADIQKEIAAVFVKAGWEVVRFNSGVMQGENRYIAFNTNMTTGMTSGFPDLCCFKNLRAVRIEVKRKGGKLSVNQEKYAKNGLQYGNPIITMDSKDNAILLLKNIELFGFESAVYNFKNNSTN